MRSELLALLLSGACACAAPRSPRFAESLTPSDVVEVAALPPSYQAGRSLRAQCSGSAGFRAIHDEKLGDVDCSRARLSRALRAAAAKQSADVIYGVRCKEKVGRRYRLSCTGTAALRGSETPLRALARGSDSELPAPSPEQVLDLDDAAPLSSSEIRVSFVPRVKRAPPPRSYDRVAEVRDLPVASRELGQVSARCDSCDTRSLRYALRVTAGSVGATDVAGVRCFREGGDARCVATAGRPWTF